VYKRDYTFRMSVMEEIFEIRSCIEILANDIKVNTADETMKLLLSSMITVLSVPQSVDICATSTSHASIC